MTRVRFRDWEIYLFKRRINGMTWYFATAWECNRCDMSPESYWSALQHLTGYLDKVDGIAPLEGSHDPF